MARLQHWLATPARKLAALALALGVLALAGDPIQGHVVTVDTRELAKIVATEVDHVEPVALADAILRGATDHRIVDLRAPEAYAAGAIPGAENIPLVALPEAGLARNEKIVLYSDGGIHAAQAWMLLRAEGYRGVTILRGGLDAWNDEVLHPVAPEQPTPQQIADFARRAQVALALGGAPRVRVDGGEPRFAPLDAGAGSATVAAPKPATPARKAPGRKKKEGC